MNMGCLKSNFEIIILFYFNSDTEVLSCTLNRKIKTSQWRNMNNYIINADCRNYLSVVCSYFIPVSQSSLQQVIRFHDFCVHSTYIARIYSADQYDSTFLTVYHVEGRSSPSVVRWHQSFCVAFLSEILRDAQNGFDSKIPDTPDRTWWICFSPQYRRHTPHLQVHHNSHQAEWFGVFSSSNSPPLQPAWCFYPKQVLKWRSVCTGDSCRLPSDHPDPSNL